eukprot:TRINITY_DN1575_c2_g2_i1.p1 TRINITY_DN1575_c2_g2~~TRINITY_DN1575_c2_g2_i1.p1  ORF type:complete len:174 (-),score=10.19 TRINITY_DN1575_c2_g2_i1:250-747(-)
MPRAEDRKKMSTFQQLLIFWYQFGSRGMIWLIHQLFFRIIFFKALVQCHSQHANTYTYSQTCLSAAFFQQFYTDQVDIKLPHYLVILLPIINLNNFKSYLDCFFVCFSKFYQITDDISKTKVFEKILFIVIFVLQSVQTENNPLFLFMQQEIYCGGWVREFFVML